METGPQLVWAIGLLGSIIAIAAWQSLEDLMGLVLVVVRATLQLFVFGYIVAMVFALQNPFASLTGIVCLVLVSAILLRNQLGAKLPLLPITLSALGCGLSAPLVYVVAFVMQPATWYDPQVLLPLAGVVLANATSGGLIAADRLLQSVRQNPATIEAILCLGGSAGQAIERYRRMAIRAAIAPILSTLGVVGLGSLPTLMAGQLLAGSDPLKAAAVQLLVMLMSLLATLITVGMLCAGIQRQLFSTADQLQQW
jgi:putative ABC transport system permease protein